MNFETIKSFILGVLVAVSLLLTFSLWSYQPQNDLLSNKPLVSEEEMDIQGAKETKKELIQPTDMIFHSNGAPYGFTNPKEVERIYSDMQSWVMYDFSIRNNVKEPNDDHMVEIVFPEALPMQFLNNLFTLNEDPYLPEWSFKRMYITFSEDQSQLNVRFEATRGDEYATVVVNNSRKYDLLYNYVTTHDQLESLVKVENMANEIYVPATPVETYNWSFTTNAIDPNQLVNALFNNPSLVKRNVSNDEINYTDGLQGMRIDKNKRSMEFYNPYDARNYEQMDLSNLIERSITSVNEHKGWTDDYHFWAFRRLDNHITYRMFYEGYPVFSSSDYATIEQMWRENELYQYTRPLFSINNQIGATKATLPSGEEVISLLESGQYASYEPEKIQDIRVGYQLTHKESTAYIMTLEPAWYMNYNGKWIQLKLDKDVLLSEKGRD
ncbi:hypothetical protein JNUCC1_01721 [Lentibacillus sp. JNUCC-1]|uniref:YycH family regulatory protein n=1 Tax=Lentibacillus sp. JNUCC-1 TaxID=2654513 RepID=UPI0012E96969|nr:two-component system activity regulator YycH [Lentibacillus sp. JNUCC-1]MUV37915.1 hypothetical protein [Lentibacillus sp. JNUCC-1]